MQTSNQLHPEQYEDYRDDWAYELDSTLRMMLAGTPQDPMLQGLDLFVHSGVQDTATFGTFIAVHGEAKIENARYLFSAMSSSSTPLQMVTAMRIEIFVGNEPFEPQQRMSRDDYNPENMLSVFNDTVVSFLVDTILLS